MSHHFTAIHSSPVEVLSGPFGSRAPRYGLTTKQVFADERLDIARTILQEFKDAGTTVGVTPTFGANARGPEEKPFDKSHHEWNRQAASITQQVFEGRKILGSIAPLLDTSGADDHLWPERGGKWAQNRHAPQIDALRSSGVSGFLAEAVRYLDEGKTLARLLEDSGAKEFICSFEARDPEGKFPHQRDLTFEQIRNEIVLATRGKINIGIGINCASAEDCTRVLENEPKGVIDAVYPNKAKVGNGHETARFIALSQKSGRTAAEDDEYGKLGALLQTGEQELRTLVERCFEQRARLIGICCGGTPDDVRFLRGLTNEYNAKNSKRRVPVAARSILDVVG